MSTKSVRVFRASLGCLVALGLGGAADTRAPAQLTLDLATLHAAALSTARNPADSSDAPYLLVSIVGTGGQTETDELPKSGHWAVRQDEAIGKTPITTITLQPGDSVRVLLTVLEDRVISPQELQIATAATTTMAGQQSPLSPPQTTLVSPTLTPLTTRGAHWLGSASLLLTNDGGTTYWNSLDCVATCTVLQSPAPAGNPAAELQAASPRPAAGVVELSGAAGVYHMQVAVRRMP